MERCRRHQPLFARLALGLLALVAELIGRSLTHRFNLGRHVAAPSYSGADYYPILLVAVKVGVALMLARVAWRVAKARAVASAADRLLTAHGRPRARGSVRVRFELSPRLWLWSFATTSLIFLVQTDAEQLSSGRWPLLGPWLHTSALPVFAVLSVIVAVVYRAVAAWLSDYEKYAREVAARALRLGRAAPPVATPLARDEGSPRGRFGLAFEIRPPPAVA